jgi:hypothetical protein
MMKCFYPALLFPILLIASFSSRSQTTASAAPAVQATAAAPKVNAIRYYPFIVDEDNLTVKLNVNDAKVKQYYTPLFKKYRYAGSVQTWEDMVEELLVANDLDFSLNNKLNYFSDENNLIVKAATKEELETFLQLVHPTFAVISRLETFIKSVDPKHIFDGSHRGETY